MSGYIFLDNWVLSSLRNPETGARLASYVRSNGFTVLLTSLSMVELYNPGWQGATQGERGAAAVHFLARVPCVIVDPARIWAMELAGGLNRLHTLPLELDLSELSEAMREATLLRFLRRDRLFLDQGKDIEAWSLNYKEAKRTWLPQVTTIIENAVAQGHLKQSEARGFTHLEDNREIFLLSLDLRHTDGRDVDAILGEIAQRVRKGISSCLTAVRLSSLYFWYSYLEIDKANRPRRLASDIGDFYHISLVPYCAAFTMDGTMHDTLQRIRNRVEPLSCQVMTKRLLEERIKP